MVVQSGLHTQLNANLSLKKGLNVDVNILAKTVRTQSGRVIGLSMQDMSICLTRVSRMTLKAEFLWTDERTSCFHRQDNNIT